MGHPSMLRELSNPPDPRIFCSYLQHQLWRWLTSHKTLTADSLSRILLWKLLCLQPGTSITIPQSSRGWTPKKTQEMNKSPIIQWIIWLISMEILPYFVCIYWQKSMDKVEKTLVKKRRFESWTSHYTQCPHLSRLPPILILLKGHRKIERKDFYPINCFTI